MTPASRTLAFLLLALLAVPAAAKTVYSFANIQTCYMAAAASAEFGAADCDAAWDRALANGQFMAHVEICDPMSGPRGCGAMPPPGRVLDPAAAAATGYLLGTGRALRQ